jgi:TolA-binding protein
MADNMDFPGPDDPHPAPAPRPEGDLPADFFDDVAEPSPVSLPPEPELAAVPEPVPVPAPPLAPARPFVPAPTPEEAPRVPIVPVVLGLLMVGALVAAVLASKMMTPEKPAAATTAPAPPSPVESVSKEFKERVDGLAAQVKALAGKVEGLPKPEPAPDLKPIQTRVDELAKSVASVGGLAEKVDKFDQRLGGLDDAVKSLKDETAALSSEVKKATEAATAAPAARPERPAEEKADETATALGRGADLFKAGKYPEAADAFQKLADANPKDARVYYYAALTHGLTTGDWQNETPRIAAKGAALEKAGSPKSSDVDAAFADLPAKLKPWLAYFRKGTR